MKAVPPISRNTRKPVERKFSERKHISVVSSDKPTEPRLVTFEIPPDKDISTYRIMNGSDIFVYRAVKRQGAKAKKCCAYCHRTIHEVKRKPISPERIQELDRRSEKTLASSSEVVKNAIQKLRRNDELKQQTPKTDEQYMAEIMKTLLAG